METHRKIKEKLKFILRSEKTTKFLDKSSSLKYVINNSTGNTNNFIDNVFSDEEDIDIELTNSNIEIDNIIVFNKRVMIKTFSSNSTNIIFKSFKFSVEVDMSKVILEVKKKLSFYDYIFIIRTDRNKKTEPFKVKYDYFLIPTSFFVSTNNYKEENTYWFLRNNREFCLIINKYVLDKHYLDYSYSYNY